MKIKFIEDYQVDDLIFERNGVWDFLDKYETLSEGLCEIECLEFIFMYRIEFEGEILHIPGTYLVEIEGVINKDYTKSQYEQFVTKDAYVKDGDYVKASKEILGVDEPVKDRADQCDYPPGWERINKETQKLYGDNAFE